MTNNTTQPNPAPWVMAHTVPLPTAASGARHFPAGVDTVAVAAMQPDYRQDLAWSSERPDPEPAQPRCQGGRVRGWMLAAAAGGIATVAATGLFLTSHDGAPKPVAIDSSTVTTPAPAAPAAAAPAPAMAAPAPAAAATHPATVVKSSRTASSDTPPAPQTPPRNVSSPAPTAASAPSTWSGDSDRTWDRGGETWSRQDDGSWRQQDNGSWRQQRGDGTWSDDDGTTWQSHGGQSWQVDHDRNTPPSWNWSLHRSDGHGGHGGEKSFGGF